MRLFRRPGAGRGRIRQDLPMRGNVAARGPGLRRGDVPANGFTLVELMVVIVIIGLLTTIVVINVFPARDQANVTKAKADVALLEQAVEMYRLDNLTYPSSSDGLQALTTPPADLVQPDRYRSGGYIKKLPNDPWGNPYQYASPGRHGAFDIYSFGADGKPGGEKNDADIGNWK